MRAETLAGAVGGRQRLLRGDRAVPARGRVAAIVAIAAGRPVALAEIAEQCLAAAADRLAEADQRLGFLALDAALALVDIAGLDEPAQIHHIGDAVGHPGVGGQPVAAGAAGLLVIGFEVFRHVEMRDKADIGLVDAHAERDRGDDDYAFLAQKALLVAGADLGRRGRRGRAAPSRPCRVRNAAVSSTARRVMQ